MSETHSSYTCRIVSDSIDIGELLAFIANDGCGASSIFVGTVRNHNDGRSVEGIEYEAYEGMALDMMNQIAIEILELEPSVRISMVHRTGFLSVGEASVVIACGHARRMPAIGAMQYAIEQLKLRVPIWKKEHYTDGSRDWVAAQTVDTPDLIL